MPGGRNLLLAPSLSLLTVRRGSPGEKLCALLPTAGPHPARVRLPCPRVLGRPDSPPSYSCWEENVNSFLTSLFSHPVLGNYCFSSVAGCSSWKQQLDFSEKESDHIKMFDLLCQPKMGKIICEDQALYSQFHTVSLSAKRQDLKRGGCTSTCDVF